MLDLTYEASHRRRDVSSTASVCVPEGAVSPLSHHLQHHTQMSSAFLSLERCKANASFSFAQGRHFCALQCVCVYTTAEWVFTQDFSFIKQQHWFREGFHERNVVTAIIRRLQCQPGLTLLEAASRGLYCFKGLVAGSSSGARSLFPPFCSILQYSLYWSRLF